MDINIKEQILRKDRFLYKSISMDLLKQEISKTKTNLRICVLLSGGLRNFEYTCDWINKFLIDPLNADVFVYGWANADGVEDNNGKINRINNVRLFKINDINNHKFEHIKNSNNLIERILGQYFNIQQCNELRKEYEISNKIEYDIIVRARPDVFFFSEIEDTDLKYLYENNSIGIPVDYFAMWSSKTTDTFAIGNRFVMEQYCQTFETVLESNYVIGEAESAVDYHIKNKIKTKIYNILPNFIIEYPYDLITENMHLSPIVGNAPEFTTSVTNRSLFQNDVVNDDYFGFPLKEVKNKYYNENGKSSFKK